MDLVRRKRHPALREVLMRPLEQRRSVVGDANVLGEAGVVALGEPVPVLLLAAVLDASMHKAIGVAVAWPAVAWPAKRG